MSYVSALAFKLNTCLNNSINYGREAERRMLCPRSRATIVKVSNPRASTVDVSNLPIGIITSNNGNGKSPSANYHADKWNNDFIQSPYHSGSYQERVDMLASKIKDMFKAIEDGEGEISPSAYDTAWVARVPASASSHSPLFPQAIKWLLNNQLQDGSWGLPSNFLLCDRLLSTLNAVIALLVWKMGKLHVQNGINFIRENIKSLENEQGDNLPPDFEIIFPQLLQKAKSLGLTLPYDLPYLKSLMEKYEAQLADISMQDSIPTRMLHALERLEEIVDWKTIMSLQSKDGSFLGSPASTACVLIHTGDEKCFTFLNNLVDKFNGGVPCMYPIDLLGRLYLVDNVERLGICRYFIEEIKVALDYVYRHWNERGIGRGRDNMFADLNTTSMGLRALRMHGYNVSPDVLSNFKDEKGGFFSCAGQSHIELRSMVNLFRATDLAYPREEIMDEARLFASTYLREALQTNNISTNKKLSNEIEYALEYSWHLSIPRLEARSYIDSYDDNNSWLGKTLYKMPYVSNTSCLEMAKLDFNIVQSMNQRELMLLSSSWKESGLAEMAFYRLRVAEVHLSAAMFEPQYSSLRFTFVKVSNFQILFDDMSDIAASLEELRIFTESIKRYDTSLIDELPDYMKKCFEVWYETMNEINNQVLRQQGRDMFNYIRKHWEVLFESYVQERKWLEAGHVPTLEEYLKTYCISVGLGPCSLLPMLVAGERVTDDILRQVHSSSKLFQLVSLTWRLTNDTKTYQAEKARGQVGSSIECYMKDNPGCTEEEALKHINEMVDQALKELNFEYFKLASDLDVPECCRKFVFNLRLCVQLFYKYKDGYSDSAGEIADYVKKVYKEPVEI